MSALNLDIHSIGRTTVDVLVMNAPERVELRRLLIRAGFFPRVQPAHD